MHRKALPLMVAAVMLVGCGKDRAPSTPAVENPADESRELDLARQTSGISPGEMLATIDLEDGTRVSFIRQDDVIVASAFARGRDAEALRELDGSLTPVEVFRQLSHGSTAPASLQKAWSAVALSMRAQNLGASAESGQPSLEPDGEGRKAGQLGTLSLSGSDFASAYCGAPGFDWNWCYTNRTGDGWVEKSSADTSYETFYSYYGHIRLQQKYLYGYWHTPGEIWLHSGDLVTGYLHTWPDSKHALSIDYATGNTWDLNFRGFW